MSQVPSAGSALAIQARWNLRRMLRTRTLWVAIIFALLPVAFAFILQQTGDAANWEGVFVLIVLLAGVQAPLFMASSMAEEIEDKTFTYLWSRPVARWTVVGGKLIAAVPIVAVLLTLTIVLCAPLAHDTGPGDLPQAMAAAAIGSVALCMVSAGFALLLPRAGLAACYAYLLAFDLPVGAIPFSLRKISLTFQLREAAGVSHVGPGMAHAIGWLLAIGALWLIIGLIRLRTAEFSTGDK